MRMGIVASGLAAGVAIGGAGAAHAQSTNFIGLGVGAIPVYEGSSEYRALPVPLINYHSGNFFITPRMGLPAMGLKTSLASDLDAGVFVGMSLGRKADDADLTKGLDDIKFHGAYGAYVEWRPGRYSLGAGYKQAARSGYGGNIELRASYAALMTEKHTVQVGVRTEWANQDAMQTWYGVTSSQAARSKAGLSTYSPSSGFKSAALFTTWSYRIDPSWSTVATVGVSTLLGDARDSPLVDRETNVFGSVGVAYRF